jgi:four helix bundle protein
MNREEMKQRTKQFALRIIRLSAALPKGREADVLGRQLLKSGTSIGANYREAVRASSRRHFVSNLEICLREGDETIYWLELLAESGVVSEKRLSGLLDECNQLVAIMTATVRTAKQRMPATTKKPANKAK